MQDAIIVSLGGLSAEEEARRAARHAERQRQSQQQLSDVAAAILAVFAAMREGRITEAGELLAAAVVRAFGGDAAARPAPPGALAVAEVFAGAVPWHVPPPAQAAAAAPAGRAAAGRRVAGAGSRELRLRRARSVGAPPATPAAAKGYCQGGGACCDGAAERQALLPPPPDLLSTPAVAAAASADDAWWRGGGWQVAAAAMQPVAPSASLPAAGRLLACACACHGDGIAELRGLSPARCTVHGPSAPRDLPPQLPHQRDATAAVVGGGASLLVPRRGDGPGRQSRQALRSAVGAAPAPFVLVPPGGGSFCGGSGAGGLQLPRRAVLQQGQPGQRATVAAGVVARARGIVRGARALLRLAPPQPLLR